MKITHIPAGTLNAEEVDSMLPEVIAFDRIENAASGLGPDFDPLATEVRQSFLSVTEYTTREFWIGRLGGDIVAKGIAYLSLQDNLDLAEVWIGVHPEHRNAGLGSELLAAMEAELRARGRVKLTCFNEIPAEAYDRCRRDAHLAAVSGTGSLPVSLPAVSFLHHHGFVLNQLERCSRADVTVAGAIDIAEADDGYSIVTWTGPTPEEHLDRVALLHQKMSTDTPGAKTIMEEEKWDADRVRELDAERIGAGQTVHTALALADGADGRRGAAMAAGFTEVSGFGERPAVGWQGATLVAKEHRGHRLGARLKIANHMALVGASGIRRVYTWNAAENSWMLAINDRAGFATFAWTGLWKKVLA